MKKFQKCRQQIEFCFSDEPVATLAPVCEGLHSTFH